MRSSTLTRNPRNQIFTSQALVILSHSTGSMGWKDDTVTAVTGGDGWDTVTVVGGDGWERDRYSCRPVPMWRRRQTTILQMKPWPAPGCSDWSPLFGLHGDGDSELPNQQPSKYTNNSKQNRENTLCGRQLGRSTAVLCVHGLDNTTPMSQRPVTSLLSAAMKPKQARRVWEDLIHNTQYAHSRDLGQAQVKQRAPGLSDGCPLGGDLSPCSRRSATPRHSRRGDQRSHLETTPEITAKLTPNTSVHASHQQCSQKLDKKRAHNP
ncbi:hypothetical protein EGW08_018486 [Elysia chlorotica]|uniref:Uncharacterized protein n=1 Tax=Elysia chlorotica TaxID=188477 RepID=A0A433SWV6_ELYCH|nr:hypothetical protein EGW08_018486 [Elysia chlorotica]